MLFLFVSMAAEDLMFTDEEMNVDEGLGYPKAYALLCKDRSFGPYSHGPPFTFTPYTLSHHEAKRAKDLDEMFPIIDLKAKPTTKPKIFVSLLWKQLNHLGNAGFDPATFRVDPYGNVLYYHADPASPLAWNVDHWFPCSRGGLTVPSNLRILQWQVCKKKHNKLEFLIPWWDLQVGVSINQFLSIFASSNSDFRRRAFSLFFLEGECEEVNDSQTVDSHIFPPHFVESKELVGLAPAAVVVTRRDSCDTSTVKALDVSRRSFSKIPIIAARKQNPSASKENENPNMVTNPHQAIVMARNSFKQQEETAKMRGEIQRLDDEVKELRERNDEEKLTIQELELVLIKRRRRAEKCRRLAEAQTSYRTMLEKMIRDTMHQSVIYKEQVRLNQAASNALMARLEAQKAICDSSERELHRKFKQRDELETLIRPEWEQARKRSRMNDSLYEEKDDKTVLYLPGHKVGTNLKKKKNGSSSDEKDDKSVICLPGMSQSETPLHKELRVFLEEEQKASEAGLSVNEEEEELQEMEKGMKKTIDNISQVMHEESNKAIVAIEDVNPVLSKLQKLNIEEDGKIDNIQYPIRREPEGEEDEESRKQRGKGNVEKWLQMLLGDAQDINDQNFQNPEKNTSKTDEVNRKLNMKFPNKEIKLLRFPESLNAEDMERNLGCNEKGDIADKGARKIKATVTEEAGGKREQEIVDVEASNKLIQNHPPYQIISRKSSSYEGSFRGKGIGSTSSFERKDRRERAEKEKVLARCESSRGLRRSPSSPSIILGGMKKGVDCIRKKPSVISDEEVDEDFAANNFIRSSIKSIKKTVKI